MQTINFSIQAPELFYLEFDNAKENNISITDLLLDNISINNDKITTVCKFMPYRFFTHKDNLPEDIQELQILPAKLTTNISENGFLVFNIFEPDTISYLLTIENKMEI